MKNNEEGEAEKMSARRRKNILVAFGGVAIVLAVAVAYLPNFPYRTEDASGAIGAVRKHRAPQIQQSDVVLGDEQTKQDQQILYGDFLADAAALQNFGADLAADTQSVEARATMAVRNLEVRRADIAARYSAAAKAALDAMQHLGAEEQLGKAAFQDLAARANNAQLAARDMQTLSASFDAMIAPCCGKSLKAVADLEAELAAYSLEARKGATLEARAFADRLNSAIDSQELGARLRAHVAYLDAMSKQAMSLEAAHRSLQARNLDARSLQAVSRDFMRQADQLEARARLGMESALAAHAGEIDVLAKISRYALDARQALDARKTLDARSLQARNNLQAFNTDLQARSRDLQARNAVGVRAQLAAIDQHMEARSNLGRRANLAAMSDSQNLAAFARDLAARSDLQARQR